MITLIKQQQTMTTLFFQIWPPRWCSVTGDGFALRYHWASYLKVFRTSAFLLQEENFLRLTYCKILYSGRSTVYSSMCTNLAPKHQNHNRRRHVYAWTLNYAWLFSNLRSKVAASQYLNHVEIFRALILNVFFSHKFIGHLTPAHFVQPYIGTGNWERQAYRPK